VGVWERGLHLVDSRWDEACTHGGMFGGDISKEDASAGRGLPSYKLTVSHSHAKIVRVGREFRPAAELRAAAKG
jgi:hypothetical protein